MENPSEMSSMLLGRLPQITSLRELIELSCSLLQASLYVVDGQGRILEHSAEEGVTCASWLNAVREGQLNEEHRRTVLTPEVNCNVVRDKQCRGTPCARLSVPIQLGDDMLAGAVVFFLWNNDPSYEKQCLAMILAGALSNLIQKEREASGTHRDAVRLLKELLNYKPGLKLYFENALKSSEFAGMTGHFHLCVLLPPDGGAQNTEEQAGRVSALSERVWAFDHHGKIIVLFSTADYTPELAGKDVVFKVKLNGITTPELPELDDEFAKDVSEFDTLDEYKADIRANLEKTRKEQADNNFRTAIMAQAVENISADIPEVMVEEKVEDNLRGYARQFGMNDRNVSLDEIKKMMGITDEIMDSSIRPAALFQVKNDLLLDAVMKAEDLGETDEGFDAYVAKDLGETDEGFDAYVAKVAEDVKASAEQLKQYFGEDFMRHEYRKELAVDLIVNSAVAKEAEKE